MATFTVTNLFDSGTGSFRQAISDANAQTGADEIIFDAGLSGGTIDLISGELGITDDLTINGLGADLLTVDAGGLSRVFNIDDGEDYDSFIDVMIDGLTITGGNVSSSGGGIFNRENLTVTSSIISDNNAGFSGGIATRDFATLRITNSIVSGNSAKYGGGIGNDNESLVEVTNSTISGNSVEESGGAIFNTDGGRVIIRNSTISSNSAGTQGGGIYNENSPGDKQLEVVNSTISGNSASQGGGIFNNESGLASIKNTIIAGNNGTNPDVEGDFISNGFNLIGDSTGSTGFENDLVEADITKILDTTLADNGGSTLTHALVPGSPAIDAGNNADVPPGISTDQRGTGFDRIMDGDGDTIAIVDIGAFEVQQPSPTAVPEPSSALGFLGLIILGTGSIVRRKRQQKS